MPNTFGARVALDLTPLRAIRTAYQQKAVLKKAIRVGGKVVQPRVKAATPRKTGLLKQAIGLKVAAGTKKTVAFAVVGARSKVKKEVRRPNRKGRRRKGGKAIFQWPAKYQHLVEFGTEPHDRPGREAGVSKKGKPLAARRKMGRHPGAKAQPFIERAWRGVAKRTMDEVGRALGDEIKKFLGKHGA